MPRRRRIGIGEQEQPGRQGRLTREELYELVWSKPISKLAPELGISGRGLAKACERSSSPVPPRGYWARKAAGQDVEQLQLPEVEVSWRNRVSISWPEQNDDEDEENEDPAPVFANDLKKRRAQARELVGEVAIPPAGSQYHPEIKRAVNAARSAAASTPQARGGVERTAPLRSTQRQRRLAVVNAMFLALEAAGVQPRIRDAEATEFSATVEGTEVFFALVQQDAYVKGRSPEKAASMLSFKLRDATGTGSAKRIWNEHAQPLEEQLTEMVVGVLVAAEEYRRDVAWAQYRQRRIEQDRARWQREQRQKDEEAGAIAKLESDAAAFRLASEIRALISAARRAHSGTEVEEWCQWAEAHAARIDPVANGRIFEPADPYDRYRSDRFFP